MIRDYYILTKPGIIRGNAITAIAGFLLASKGSVDLGLLVAMLAGVSLVMASACVYNNYLDREIDQKMERTKNRALVTGAISIRNAMIFATGLCIAGFSLLAIYTNWLTVFIGLVGFVDYIVLYGISKRRSIHGTIIGSISGATPPVAGYTAVTGRFDTGAVLLFLVLVFWQMPHFYAIAVYRIKDYRSASIPVLPIVKGMRATKLQIVVYMFGFIIATSLLTVFGYTGHAYLVIMLAIGFVWLRIGAQGFVAKNDEKWAKKVFGFSLITLLVFSVLISIDVALPR